MSLILFGPSQVNSDIYVTNLWRIQKTRQSFWWPPLQNEWHICQSFFLSDIYVTHQWVTYMSLKKGDIEWHICQSFATDIYVIQRWVTYVSLYCSRGHQNDWRVFWMRHELMTYMSLFKTLGYWLTYMSLDYCWHICHSNMSDICVSRNQWRITRNASCEKVTYMSLMYYWHICHSKKSDIYVTPNQWRIRSDASSEKVTYMSLMYYWHICH